jgi:hypothetical protein
LKKWLERSERCTDQTAPADYEKWIVNHSRKLTLKLPKEEAEEEEEEKLNGYSDPFTASALKHRARGVEKGLKRKQEHERRGEEEEAGG